MKWRNSFIKKNQEAFGVDVSFVTGQYSNAGKRFVAHVFQARPGLQRARQHVEQTSNGFVPILKTFLATTLGVIENKLHQNIRKRLELVVLLVTGRAIQQAMQSGKR